MSPSLCLITAALLTAQVPDGRLEAVPAGTEMVAPNPGCNCGNNGGWQPAPMINGPREHHGLFPRLSQRLHELFGDDQASQPTQARFQGQIIQAPVMQAQPMPARSQGDLIEEQSGPGTGSESEPPLAGQSQHKSAAIPVMEINGQPKTIQILDGAAAQGIEVLDGDAAPGAEESTPAQKKLPAQAGHDAEYHKITGRLAFLPSGGGTWLVRYGDHGADNYGGLVELSTAADMHGLRSGDLVTIEGELLSPSATSNLETPLFRAHTVRLVEHVQ